MDLMAFVFHLVFSFLLFCFFYPMVSSFRWFFSIFKPKCSWYLKNNHHFSWLLSKYFHMRFRRRTNWITFCFFYHQSETQFENISKCDCQYGIAERRLCFKPEIWILSTNIFFGQKMFFLSKYVRFLEQRRNSISNIASGFQMLQIFPMICWLV